MKFGYFTLTDNPPAYGPGRRDPNRFVLDVVEECVEAEAMGYMMAAWPQSPFEFHGRYYATPEPLTIVPRPLQTPHPPVYVACFSKPSIELAARLRVHTIFAPFAAAMLFGSIQDAARESKRMAIDAG